QEVEVEAGIASRVLWVELPGGLPGLVHLEAVPRLLKSLGRTLDELSPRPLVEGESAAVEDLRRLLDRAGEEEADEEAGEALLAELLAEWSRFYGPVARQRPEQVFGIGGAELEEALEALVEGERVVLDEITTEPGSGLLELCDSENLERLLRLARSQARPRFEALDLALLPAFLATHQGLGKGASGIEDLQGSLEKLLLHPLPAEAWEGEVLPARLDPYYPSWLDEVLQTSDLLWRGCGRRKLTFAFPSDVEELAVETLAGEEEEEARDLDAVFPDPRGRYAFEDLQEASGLGAEELHRQLWRWAWQGRVSNDSFETVRSGIAGKFTLPRRESSAAFPRRGRHQRWQTARRPGGRWFRLMGRGADDGELDALDREELAKERARALLERYGVLFRELTLKELPELQWRQVFRALRLMELSGEVLAGQFFRGIRGLQFATHEAFRQLRGEIREDEVFWLAARDPASVAGLGLEGLSDGLPDRRAGNYLVYHGRRPVVLAWARGRRLEIRVPPDHPDLSTYLSFLKVLIGRQAHPLKSVEVREVNGEPVFASPYLEALRTLASATREAQGLRLRRRY
ncbi:MAG: ATP-dependent helicase, partial [Acidobacteria bacterium]|nr:ATP-dependent helicase [Acidobacteriota bacterium]